MHIRAILKRDTERAAASAGISRPSCVGSRAARSERRRQPPAASTARAGFHRRSGGRERTPIAHGRIGGHAVARFIRDHAAQGPPALRQRDLGELVAVLVRAGQIHPIALRRSGFLPPDIGMAADRRQPKRQTARPAFRPDSRLSAAGRYTAWGNKERRTCYPHPQIPHSFPLELTFRSSSSRRRPAVSVWSGIP